VAEGSTKAGRTKQALHRAERVLHPPRNEHVRRPGLTTVIASSLIASKGYSQVVIGAHIGLRLPAPRVYVAATIPAPVVYAPAPVYTGGYFYRDHAAYFNHGAFDHAHWEHGRGFACRGGYSNHGRRW
jgi:hypothetical protein